MCTTPRLHSPSGTGASHLLLPALLPRRFAGATVAYEWQSRRAHRSQRYDFRAAGSLRLAALAALCFGGAHVPARLILPHSVTSRSSGERSVLRTSRAAAAISIETPRKWGPLVASGKISGFRSNIVSYFLASLAARLLVAGGSGARWGAALSGEP